ncbi:aldo/keto reductase [Cognatishimia activa]|uniref:Aldo/keto reductase n=1 Tax=Cognatishimia activa TaxID=1715691 RepID=A0A975EPU6_9RHOB|nr:aldo/keto reductase [Cognatishimia activa]QTN35988.1 aldo/keto reductase [Cognatishimia activa]
MKRNPLGQTDITVSALSLGTMTFGTQTPKDDAFQQMDMALEAGIDFWDTAEMYPVNPIAAEHTGRSEEFLGDWFEKTGRRNEVVLATKHSGAGLKIWRDGAPISSQTISEAIDGSLKRLKTDHIDLYQFHWPNRGSYMFRQNWTYDPSGQNKAETLAHMEDALEALQKEVDKGRIRAFGLSNESAWGTAQWLRISEDKGLPRVASVQNEYSLMCRMYDTDLAELSVNEDVGLMAFSPLATGYLTGKYRNGAIPKGSRMDINGNLGGRVSDRAPAAVEAYMAVAQKHGLDLVHMSLAWCMQRPFMMSAIFGATSVEQLAHIIAGKDLVLSPEVMKDIDAAHRAHPMPY